MILWILHISLVFNPLLAMDHTFCLDLYIVHTVRVIKLNRGSPICSLGRLKPEKSWKLVICQTQLISASTSIINKFTPPDASQTHPKGTGSSIAIANKTFSNLPVSLPLSPPPCSEDITLVRGGGSEPGLD